MYLSIYAMSDQGQGTSGAWSMLACPSNLVEPSSAVTLSSHFPLPLDFNYCRSFQPHACCHTLTHNTFSLMNWILDTFHIQHCVLCYRQEPFGLQLYLSPLSLSLHSIHCITADSDHINTQHLALLKGRQIGPSFPLCLCAFLGNHGPLSLLFPP